MEEETTARQERAEDNINYFDDFRESIQSEKYKPIKTGLDFFEELMDGGAQVQTLTILLAAQGSGKTMLFQNLAESIATENKKKVIYLNFEMSHAQLLARAISARVYKRGNMKKTAKDILRGYQWTDAERDEILEAIDEYERESLPYIAYNPKGVKAYLEDIEAYLNELTEQGDPAPVLFVDYLQLIQSYKNQDIKDRLTEMLIDLKKYAIKNNTMVYLISAINRQSQNNQSITTTSARDTSAIEYQADYLISLENYKEQEAANRKGLQRMKLKLLKSRDGENDRYSIVYRDGVNNLFTGEYKGVYQEQAAVPDQEDIPEAYAFLNRGI